MGMVSLHLPGTGVRHRDLDGDAIEVSNIDSASSIDRL